MTLTGEVIAIENESVEVSFKGKNGLGNHVVGTAYIELRE